MQQTTTTHLYDIYHIAHIRPFCHRPFFDVCAGSLQVPNCALFIGEGGAEGTASLFLIAWAYFGGDEHTLNTIGLLACFIVGCGDWVIGVIGDSLFGVWFWVLF